MSQAEPFKRAVTVSSHIQFEVGASNQKCGPQHCNTTGIAQKLQFVAANGWFAILSPVSPLDETPADVTALSGLHL